MVAIKEVKKISTNPISVFNSHIEGFIIVRIRAFGIFLRHLNNREKGLRMDTWMYDIRERI